MNIDMSNHTSKANQSSLAEQIPQLNEPVLPPMSPHAASDLAPSPFNLTSVSTHQTDIDSAARSPLLNNYTLSQAAGQVPGCTGNTSQILSPVNPIAQKLPELVGIPISHSLSYQPIIHEPQPAVQTKPSAQTKPRPPRNKSKFKRFRNAFIYYVNDQRNKVDEETKKLKNREFLRLMSSRWKSMSEVERKPYVQLAEEDKRRFNEDEKKFGKYESRQRRYNKVRTSAKHHGTAPYSLPQPALPSHTQFPNMLAANPTLFYGNLANVTPGQAGVNAEALSHLYMNLQKQPGTPVNNTQTNPQLLVNSSATRQPQYQSQQSFLAPPPSLDQRNSAPSSTGSVADINDLQSTLRPSSNYNWSAAALGGAVSAAAAHAQYPNAAATALYQQPSSPGFMQLPTGAPISHSLTHPPALYDNGLNLPLNGGNSGSNWSLQQ